MVNQMKEGIKKYNFKKIKRLKKNNDKEK